MRTREKEQEFSILVRNGKILDGTGNPWFKADLGIKEDKIVEIADLKDAKSKDLINAKGLYVVPGFIDIHSHSDLTPLLNPKGESKIKQGVTTELVGNCGWSAAPLTKGNSIVKDMFNILMPILPPQWNWNSFEEYRDVITRCGLGINLVGLVGHNTVRSNILGHQDRLPNNHQLAQMKSQVSEAMDHGAFGISTGLTYLPGCFAQREEIIDMALVVSKKRGFYASHIRGQHAPMEKAVREALYIAKKAEIPLELSHFTPRASMRYQSEVMMSLLQNAREQGIEVTCDLFVYPFGETTLTSFLPHWAREGNTTEIRQRLKDNTKREQIIKEWHQGPLDNRISSKAVLAIEGEWDKLWLSKAPNNKDLEGKTFEEIGKLRGQKSIDMILDLLLEENAQITVRGEDAVEPDIEYVLKHELSMVGSDGLALSPEGDLGKSKLHPRSYGNHARVIARYVREKGILSCSEAIRKMTSLPAQKIGLKNRGFLKEGMCADVTIFDLQKVKDLASINNPYRYAKGIEYVIINGELVINKGEFTDNLPGRFLTS